MYDFWSVKKKEAATDPIPVSTTKIEVGKGQYYVRFFFPVPDGYEIFWGPRIDIR
jgi:hypothetical protein